MSGAVWVTDRFDGKEFAQVINRELCVRIGSISSGVDPARADSSLFSAQVFNNVTTAANSGNVDTSDHRYAVVFIDLQDAGAPTDIRLIAQFSDDGGTTWYDYAVDQWVDLRYVPTQITAAGGQLLEAIPLNYVIGSLFRLRAVATGTTAVNTFTLSAHVELST